MSEKYTEEIGEENTRETARETIRQEETKAFENLRLAKDFEKVFESRLKNALNGGRLNMSAIQHAMSVGAGATEAASDYLNDVYKFTEKNRPHNASNQEFHKLSDELKGIRGKLESEWTEQGSTPEGYDPEQALEQIRDLFRRLRNISL